MTRAFFVDFATYNTNTNRFTIVRLLFEMPLGGGVASLTEYNTLKLYRSQSPQISIPPQLRWSFFRYTDPLDFFVLFAEVVLTGIQCAFVLSQVQKVSCTPVLLWILT